MQKHPSKFLTRAPRILAILFTLFISIFALDVFEMNLGFRGTIVALLMHLIPSFILIAILIISRKHELVGAIAFALAGLAYITIVSINQLDRQIKISRSLIVALPAILTGILFRFSRRKKKQ